MQLKPHQERVVVEKSELDAKLAALDDFINHSPLWKTVEPAERHRMGRQWEIMKQYSAVLNERIEAFHE